MGLVIDGGWKDFVFILFFEGWGRNRSDSGWLYQAWGGLWPPSPSREETADLIENPMNVQTGFLHLKHKGWKGRAWGNRLSREVVEGWGITPSRLYWARSPGWHFSERELEDGLAAREGQPQEGRAGGPDEGWAAPCPGFNVVVLFYYLFIFLMP